MLVLLVVLPEGIASGISAFFVLVPLTFLGSEISQDLGKRLEQRLWREWRGPPTTRFLRHAGEEFNESIRERVHEKLRGLSVSVPSPSEEERDPAAADVRWEACTKEIIRRTRNRQDFPLVFESLASYGFRRNLLGLKPYGLALSVAALAICLCQAWGDWGDQVAIVTSVVAFFLCCVWIAWVTSKTASISANRYAHALLEAAQKLE